MKGKGARVFCDGMIVTDLSSDKSHLMVTFVSRRSRSQLPVSFAGIFNDSGVLAVDHVYFRPGEAFTAVDGWCRPFFDASGQDEGMMCVAFADEGGQRTAAIIDFAYRM